MKKFFDKIRKNNKGFTLVELIIVIAVMAVLTVVAAPQYLKYVENSRVGTDENALGEIAHIAEIEFVGYSVDNVVTTDTVTFAVEIDDEGVVEFVAGSTNSADEDLIDVIEEAFGDYKFKSNTYRGTETTDNSVTFTITKATGKCTFPKAE